MTIRITVKVEEDRDCQVEVTTMGVGGYNREVKLLNGGESGEFWVHSMQHLQIRETKN